MKESDKNAKKSPFPPSNVSVNYYTDPIYSTDAFYGYDEEDNPREEAKGEKREEALDEPVESWGWINNVD
ncbi:MAG: hypothetical protein ACYC21_09865 [Eubacteriales bacterium]